MKQMKQKKYVSVVLNLHCGSTFPPAVSDEHHLRLVSNKDGPWADRMWVVFCLYLYFHLYRNCICTGDVHDLQLGCQIKRGPSNKAGPRMGWPIFCLILHTVSHTHTGWKERKTFVRRKSLILSSTKSWRRRRRILSSRRWRRQHQHLKWYSWQSHHHPPPSLLAYSYFSRSNKRFPAIYVWPHSKDFNYPTKPAHLDLSQQSSGGNWSGRTMDKMEWE